MRATLLFCIASLFFGCASYRLPLKVRTKTQYERGCSLYVESSDESGDRLYFDTETRPEYCEYQIGQEIK
jgi:hypothetical protein